MPPKIASRFEIPGWGRTNFKPVYNGFPRPAKGQVGHFVKGAYEIKDPAGPVWSNYFADYKSSQGRAIVNIDQRGGAFGCFETAHHPFIRFTMAGDQPSSERGGLYGYILDQDSKEFFPTTWATNNIPQSLYKYACRIHKGYMEWETKCRGIKMSTYVYVKQGKNTLVWSTTITNESNRSRALVFAPYIPHTTRSFQDNANYQHSEYVEENNELPGGGCANLTYGRSVDPYHDNDSVDMFAFVPDRPYTSFEFDARKFIGPNELFSLNTPADILVGKGQNNLADTGSGCSAFFIPAVNDGKRTLAPGESVTINIGVRQIGLSNKTSRKIVSHEYHYRNGKPNRMTFLNDVVRQPEIKKAAAGLRSDISGIKTVKSDLRAIDEHVNGLLSYFRGVRTPLKKINEIFGWLIYQPIITYILSRSWSRKGEDGKGRVGLGFRDACQDALSVPLKMMRERILILAKAIYSDGRAIHLVNPATGQASESNQEDQRKGFDASDDPHWLIKLVDKYVKESGDVKFLKTMTNFADGGKASIMDVLEAISDGAEKTCDKKGFGLTKQKDGSWNDPLKIEGVDVFTACLHSETSREVAGLEGLLGKNDAARKYGLRSQRMSDKINKFAFDKAGWYKRGYWTKDKKWIGVHGDDTGQIYNDVNPLAVLTGVADSKRAKTVVDSINKRLSTRFGMKLLDPFITAYRRLHGQGNCYPETWKENGGFNQPVAWDIIAACMTGQGDLALKWFKKMLPNNFPTKIHKREPYSFTQITNPKTGEAFNPWLTATATWMNVAFKEYILGVRPEHNGLLIDPCIDHSWKGFELTREFRGNTYNIIVKNPKHVQKGVKKMTIMSGDKVMEITGNMITNTLTPFGSGKTYTVEVEMG
jgi:cellobiose phosphorylase